MDIADVLWPHRHEQLYEVVPGEYHSTEELYDHRAVLFIALLKDRDGAWWSRQHEDPEDPMYQGFVLAGITLSSGDVSYHLREKFIPLLELADIEELPVSPPFSGYTPDDVAERLAEWCIK